jgi:hypothetical protein
MIGDLWYGVATQGRTEGRCPGFEPQSVKSEKAQGGVQNLKRLKGECKI